MQNVQQDKGIRPFGWFLIFVWVAVSAVYAGLIVYILFPEFTDETLVPAAKLIWAFIRENLLVK